jgi:hypothetical protein
MIDTLYPLRILQRGVFEVIDRKYEIRDAIKTFRLNGECVLLRAWVKFGDELRRKTIIRCQEDTTVFLYISQESLSNDETVVDIREADPLMPEEGLVSGLAQRIGHNYAVLWVTRKARHRKLERDWPELSWLFEAIREDEEMAQAYAQSDEKTPVFLGGTVVELGEYRRSRRGCGG